MTLTAKALREEPYSQAHLFEGLNAEMQENLVQQLNELDGKLPGGGLRGYLQRARGLLADAKKGTNPFAGLRPVVPAGERLTGETGPGTAAYAALEKLGMAELGNCAFCLVAGGLGERLGYPGIKIGIPAEITTETTFIETYARFILAFQDYARAATGDSALELPLAIMTSGDTHAKTVELLEANSNFGLSGSQLTLMKQELVPALLDIDARIAVEKGVVLTKPHGHGDVHSLLHQHGLPKKWAEQGKRWLLLFQDTNPLPFRSLCAVLGVSAKNNFVLNSVTVPRLPCEAVGGICQLDDPSKGTSLTINVEYNQLDPLLKETPAGGDVADATGFSPYPGNINVLVFKLSEMAENLEKSGGIVPEFVNPKWADAGKSKFKSPTRLECMMQDFPRLCAASQKVGFTQLERLMSFTCVKNNIADAKKKSPPDCALSAEADIYACSAQLLQLAGADVEIEPPDDVSFLGITAKVGARIILHPAFAVSLEHMKEKVKGKIRISKASVLILDGDVSIDGLDLDGALTVTGKGTLKDAVVRNASCPMVAIPDGEMSMVTPAYQIRGYRMAAGEMEQIAVSPPPARYNVSPEIFERLLRGEEICEKEITGSAPITDVGSADATKTMKKKKTVKVSKKKTFGCC
jgi:UDP-sugar pyrophosphorylase